VHLDALEATVARYKKAGIEGASFTGAEKHPAAWRAQRLEAESPQTQVIALNGRLSGLKGKLAKLETGKDDKAKAAEEARKDLGQRIADREAHATDLDNTKLAILEVEREVQAAAPRLAPAAAPGGGAHQAPAPALDAAQQEALSQEVLAEGASAPRLAPGAAKVLVGLLGKARGSGGSGGVADAADDEQTPDSFDQET
ncbi:unnamed protein product, partial [Prorocentrum cordatum]